MRRGGVVVAVSDRLVRIPAVPLLYSDSEQVVHTHVPLTVTNKYNLALVNAGDTLRMES